MSTQTVTDKIEEKARLSAEETLAEARKTAETTVSSLIEDANKRAEAMIAEAKKRAEIYESGRRRTDELETKLALLEAKREVIDGVKSAAREKLLAADDAKFAKIFSKYLANASLSGEFTLVPSPEHKELCKKSLSDLEKCAGIKLSLSEERADFNGGFTLIGEDYDVEFSLDEIIESVFERDEKAIADILFETGDVEK